MDRIKTPFCVPEEFDLIRTGKGYTMKGWDFRSEDIALALRDNRMLNPAYELASNKCPWNCFFCFTEDPNNPLGLKKKLEGELTLDERLNLIDQSKILGAKSINIIGAGEPTIDEHFWEIVEHIHKLDMTPIVYTEGSLKLTDPSFASRLYNAGATIVLKVNSLKNRDYQNSVVRGGKERVVPLRVDYFEKRNEALKILKAVGFNNHDPTRLAFDTIICKENLAEIPMIHRHARENNIFVLFVNYLPSGRSAIPLQNAITRNENYTIFNELAKIDREEYGLVHRSIFPYAGGVPCSIRGLGLYVKIKGDAFDCPGETEALGNIKKESLANIWQKTRHIRENFDGGCLPRENFWKKFECKSSCEDCDKPK
ncbi:MAG: radical SAM protein [Nanoarchaeota archaeon]